MRKYEMRSFAAKPTASVPVSGRSYLVVVWAILLAFTQLLLFTSCEPEKPYAKIQREAAAKRAEQIRTGEIPAPPQAKVYQYPTTSNR